MIGVAKQINEQLKKSRKVMIVPHQHPDGDALGSAAAMREYLQTLEIPTVIFCATEVSPRWNFIPHSGLVTADAKHFSDKEIDTIVVLDSGDLHYAGVDILLKDHPAQIINIDHHQTNARYGHLNLAIPSASATAEIIYYFLQHNKVHLTPIIGTALLAGIITDTDNFTNSATTTAAMLVAGELLRAGANLNLINNHTVRNKTLSSLRLWGTALARLTHDENTGITYTYLLQKDLIDNKALDSEVEGVANFLNNLEGSKIAMILRENPDGKFKGSMRTTKIDVDVAVIAKALSGGGHKKAAGFTIDGPIEVAIENVLQVAKKMIG